AELETHRMQRADHVEAGLFMQRDRGDMRAVADHRDHLPPGAELTSRDQCGQQRTTDPAACLCMIDIDRILQAETVGRARAIRTGIAVAKHASAAVGDEIGQPPRKHIGATALDLLDRWRRLLEGCGAVQNVMRIDCRDLLEILVTGVAHNELHRKSYPRLPWAPCPPAWYKRSDSFLCFT